MSRWRGVLATLAGVAACVAGAFVVAPGIDAHVLGEFLRSGGSSPLLRAFDWAVGGAMSHGAIAALGAMPYVSARLYLWLARRSSRRLAAMVDQPGGEARFARWTRGLTFVLAAIQSYGFARFVEAIPGAVTDPGTAFVLRTTAVLTATVMCAVWVHGRFGGPDEDDVTAGPHSIGVRSALSLPQPRDDFRIPTPPQVEPAVAARDD